MTLNRKEREALHEACRLLSLEKWHYAMGVWHALAVEKEGER